MAGLDKIISQIKEESQKAAERTRAEARSKADEILAQARADAERECVDIERRSKQAVANILERGRTAAELKKRGAVLAEKKYDITDEEVLGAIRWHTTGRPDMTLLEKIVYVADYIEPKRDKAPNLGEIRKLAFIDLDRALLKILQDTLNYLGDSPEDVDSMTKSTYDFYQQQLQP